jgi:hypothetical protein
MLMLNSGLRIDSELAVSEISQKQLKSFVGKTVLFYRIYEASAGLSHGVGAVSVVFLTAMIGVPDHDGGRPIEVNACILITHMVYL